MKIATNTRSRPCRKLFRIIDRNGTQWSNDFESIVDLWCWWLDFVACCLHEEQSAKTFINKYWSASDECKKEMESWLDLYQKEETPKEMTALIYSVPPITADNLPNNWRLRISNQLKDGQGSFSFITAVKKVIRL